MRLSAIFGDRYTARNVVLTATHTHCGPGGHGRHMLYNITTAGFHPARSSDSSPASSTRSSVPTTMPVRPSPR